MSVIIFFISNNKDLWWGFFWCGSGHSFLIIKTLKCPFKNYPGHVGILHLKKKKKENLRLCFWFLHFFLDFKYAQKTKNFHYLEFNCLQLVSLLVEKSTAMSS